MYQMLVLFVSYAAAMTHMPTGVVRHMRSNIECIGKHGSWSTTVTPPSESL